MIILRSNFYMFIRFSGPVFNKMLLCSVLDSPSYFVIVYVQILIKLSKSSFPKNGKYLFSFKKF